MEVEPNKIRVIIDFENGELMAKAACKSGSVDRYRAGGTGTGRKEPRGDGSQCERSNQVALPRTPAQAAATKPNL